jgi:DNA-binding XRE family transcriptional regulator
MTRVECNRLRGIVAERKLTIEWIAKKIGISVNSLSIKINGHREFKFSEAYRIANLLEMEVRDVFPELIKAVTSNQKAS